MIAAFAPEEFNIRLLHRHTAVAAAAAAILPALRPSHPAPLWPGDTAGHCDGTAAVAHRYGDNDDEPSAARGEVLETPRDGREASEGRGDSDGVATANGAFVEEARSPASSAERLAEIVAMGLEASASRRIGWDDRRGDDARDALCFAFVAALRAVPRAWAHPDAGAASAFAREEIERVVDLWGRLVGPPTEAQLCEALRGHLATPASRLHAATRLLCPSDGEDAPALLPVLTQLAESVQSIAAPSIVEERCWLSPTRSVGGLLVTGLVAAASFAALCSWLPSLRRLRASDDLDALLT